MKITQNAVTIAAAPSRRCASHSEAATAVAAALWAALLILTIPAVAQNAESIADREVQRRPSAIPAGEAERARGQDAHVVCLAPISLDGTLDAIHIDGGELVVACVPNLVIGDPCAVDEDAVVGGIDIRVCTRLHQFVGEHLGDAVMSRQRTTVIDPCVVTSDAFVSEALVLAGKLGQAIVDSGR